MDKDLVNKLMLSLAYSSEMSGNDALKLTKTYFDDYCQQTIEKVFRQYQLNNIRIEKLDIDLGKVHPTEIPQKLYNLLESEIRKYISEQKFSKPELNIQRISNQEPIEEFPEDNGSKTKNQITDNLLSHFLAYLQNPNIPWFLSDEHQFNIDSLVINSIRGCLADNISLQHLIMVISRNRHAFYRFIYLIKEPILDTIIRKYLTISNQTSIDNYDKISNSISTCSNHYKKEIKAWLFESILYNLPSLNKHFSSEIFFTSDSGHKNRAVITSERKSDSSSETFFASDSGHKNQTGSTSKRKFDSSTEKKELHQTVNDWGRAIVNTYKTNKENIENTAPESFHDTIEHILIFNAGLVLLCPMLPAFFKQLKYLDENGKFKSTHHQIRAVHVLQVFTGSKTKHYDHLLQLNKIICGLDILFPVNPAFSMTKQEKEEVSFLLESVLSHWHILKSTSINGLQESFIRRKGVIEKSGDDWIVHVENKGIDILLDDLPWGINLLSLPWNDFMIHVDWKR